MISWLKKLFCKKKKYHPFPVFYFYNEAAQPNRNYRKYDQKALLDSFKRFRKTKVGKAIEIISNSKIKLTLAPKEFEDLGLSDELLKEITKKLTEDIIADINRELITGRKSQ